MPSLPPANRVGLALTDIRFPPNQPPDLRAGQSCPAAAQASQNRERSIRIGPGRNRLESESLMNTPTPMMKQYEEAKRACPGALAVVSHGRLLRDVSRGRQDRGPRAQPGPHLARQRRKRHAYGRLSPPPVGKLPRQADRRRLPRRRLRTGRRSQAGQGTGETRSHAGRHAWHDHRRRPLGPPREQLPGGRFAGRSGGPGLGGDFTGRFLAAISPWGNCPINSRGSRLPNACWPKTRRRYRDTSTKRWLSCAGPAGPSRWKPPGRTCSSIFMPIPWKDSASATMRATTRPCGRRRGDRLSQRNAKDLAGTCRSLAVLSQLDRPGDRRGEPP